MEEHPVKPCDGLAALTLDEAIEHAEAKSDDTPCGREHAALAAWLRELRHYRYRNAVEIAKDAPSAPLRNCDVGTADEQYDRHDKYCNSQPTCRKCLREDAASTCIWCFAKWAQRPYESIYRKEVTMENTEETQKVLTCDDCEYCDGGVGAKVVDYDTGETMPLGQCRVYVFCDGEICARFKQKKGAAR